MEQQTKSKYKFRVMAGMLLFLGAFLFFMYPSKKISPDYKGQESFERATKDWAETEKLKLNTEQGLLPSENKPNLTNSEILPEDFSLKLNSKDKEKFKVLLQILKSKNDNDPRMDQNLKDLSTELRQAITTLYPKLPYENRSERGTLAFLIAREIRTLDDLEFLKSILSEEPCLSLENCGSRSEDIPHHSGVEEQTLTYPQTVVLYQLEKQLKANPKLLNDQKMKEKILDTLDRAANYPVPSIQKRALSIKNKYNL